MSDSSLRSPRIALGSAAAVVARRAIPDARSSNHSNKRNPASSLNTVRWAMTRESTLEIYITLRKTRAELAEFSLLRVMHPLLFRTASTV